MLYASKMATCIHYLYTTGWNLSKFQHNHVLSDMRQQKKFGRFLPVCRHHGKHDCISRLGLHLYLYRYLHEYMGLHEYMVNINLPHMIVFCSFNFYKEVRGSPFSLKGGQKFGKFFLCGPILLMIRNFMTRPSGTKCWSILYMFLVY